MARTKVKRASRISARNYLNFVFTQGGISGYEELKGGRWLITTMPTKHEAFNGAHVGQIALTTREVLAFTEGYWAGKQILPNTRAGDGA